MTIKDKLILKLPLIQAPLTAYPKQVELVTAISEQGALGVYSSDFQTLADIKKDIKTIQKRTKQPFAVLIDLAESDTTIDLADRSSTNTYLQTAYRSLKIEATEEAPEFPDVNDVCKTTVALRPPVLIFQNGIPTDAFIEHCQRNGIITLGIASNTLEAIAIDYTQIDGIILQGSESAGVQSQFENDLVTQPFPTNTLLHHAKNNTSKPLIVWGDCQTPEAAALLLGQNVKAVVLDVPFWTVDESPIPNSYRNALNEHNEMNVTTTSVWNGQTSQVLQNALTRNQQSSKATTLATGKQKRLLKPVIEAAIKQNNVDYMPLWAGICAVSSSGSLVELCKTYADVLASFLSAETL